MLISACGAAVEGDCVSSNASSDVEPRAVAIVVWDAETRRVRIEVGLQRARASGWRVRELRFETSDPVEERWRAAGFAVGTLVGRVEREQRHTPGTEPLETDPGKNRAGQEAAAPNADNRAAEQDDSANLARSPRADIVLLVAPRALGDSSVRFGAGGRLGLPLGAGRFIVFGSVRYLLRPPVGQPASAAPAKPTDDLYVGWFEAGGGGAVALGESGPASLELRAELFTANVHATVDRGQTRDGATRWIGGARLGLDGLWALTTTFRLTAGAEIGWTPSPTRVLVDDQTAGETDPFGVVFSAGVRVIFGP